MEECTQIGASIDGTNPGKKYTTRTIHRSDRHSSGGASRESSKNRYQGRKSKDRHRKRVKGVPREEATPARDTVEDTPPVQSPPPPAAPQHPQKASSPPAVTQPSVSKSPVQIPNSKAKEKKERTPETPVPIVPQQTAPQKASPPPPPSPSPPPPAPSPPPVKEESPQPAASPTPEDNGPDPPKEVEVNNVEIGINNVHREEKKEDTPQLKYSYKEDQWSPLNKEGKRQYDRRFLLELQNNPLSLKKPESLPDLEVVRDEPGKPKVFDNRGPMPHAGGGPDFTPDYVKSMGNKHPKMVVRSSQQRRDMGGGGGGGGGSVSRGGGGRGNCKIIIIPHATGRDAKLKTVENAWKPSVKEKKKPVDEKAETDEVLKTMRGILNKLTPEKFEKLVSSVKKLPFDTNERMSAVIDLIFEKAIDEQSFSSTYAKMCHVLSSRENGGDKPEARFKCLIIGKCQKEFEKETLEEKKIKMKEEINACNDKDKKLELLAKFDYEEAKLRKRSVGNIRFIGELYKLKMMTSTIMMRIIETSLNRGDVESLECVCKLLTTVGEALESHCSQQPKAMADLDKHFKKMERIVNERSTISRVRFLIMDVIDLRHNNWVPRREDNKPKTKAQVHEDAKREEFEQQIALANRNDNRDRDRDRRRPKDSHVMQSSDDGWNTVASTKGRTSFDSSRLKNTFNRCGAGDKEPTLRGIGFSSWGRGSSGGGHKDYDERKQQESNRFNVLMDSGGALPLDNRRPVPPMGGPRLAPGGGPARQGGFGSKSMPPPSNDRENVLSDIWKLNSNTDRKSFLRPQSRDNSLPRETEDFRNYPSVDPEEARKHSIAIIEEYTTNPDAKEAKKCIKEKFTSRSIKYFVQFSLEWVIDRDSKKRTLVGQLYHLLIMERHLTIKQLLEGSEETLSLTEEYIIDIPQVCEYLGEVYAPCLVDNAVSLDRLLELASFAKTKQANVFASIVSNAPKLMGEEVVELWHSSGLSWEKIVQLDVNVGSFLKKYHLEFTVEKGKPCTQEGWTFELMKAQLFKQFKRTSSSSNHEIFKWVDANMGEKTKSSLFIRALVTALVESQASIFTPPKDGSTIRIDEEFETNLKNRLDVVLKYVDNLDHLEMQCIYALQALCVKHAHPPGLLEKCFNAFYDSDVLSEDIFDEWAKSQNPEEQAGKGVCLNSVKNFMRWLKSTEVEDREDHA